jgi:hypothetical protein
MTALLQATGHEAREAHDGPAGLAAAFEFGRTLSSWTSGCPG